MTRRRSSRPAQRGSREVCQPLKSSRCNIPEAGGACRRGRSLPGRRHIPLSSRQGTRKYKARVCGSPSRTTWQPRFLLSRTAQSARRQGLRRTPLRKRCPAARVPSRRSTSRPRRGGSSATATPRRGSASSRTTRREGRTGGGTGRPTRSCRRPRGGRGRTRRRRRRR